ncbi:tRNA-intron endonuclease catalytic domain-like protein, partial [Pluteus cervinus]
MDEGIARRIILKVVNKQAFVWTVDDIAELRSTHRICGILTGTLPHISQQNIFLGVPLMLMPEEAVLLVEKEIAVLADDPQAYPEPSIEQIQRWDAQEQQSMAQQVAAAEAKGANPEHTMSEAAIRKRREREERKLASASAAATASVNDELLGEPSGSPSKYSNSKSPAPKNTIPYTVVIPTKSEDLEWYAPEPVSYSTVEAAKTAGIWEYPANLEERARCGVFRDLWEQGFFLGGGIKFGGDYLVYPGDPLRFHSHFAASVVQSPTATLRPMEIVAHGRLGTATKKSHLMCCWDDEGKKVSYVSIEWAGFG